MRYRSLAVLAFAPLAIVAACSNSDNTSPNNTAMVRFVNATNSSIDVANNGTVATGNGSLGFGTNSTCMTVNTASNALAFNSAGTSTAITGFTQNFTAGGNYTVVAYPNGSSTSFATISNGTFTPTSGQAGLRVFNAAAGTGSLVINSGGTALGTGTGVGFGTSGTFMSVAPGSQTFTFNTGTGTSTVATTGTLSLTAGQNYTLIVAPPATGSSALRTFLVTGC
jgi:uncharacterized protein DUF4397